MNNTNFKMSFRWIYLIFGVVAMLFSGVLYAWSILKAPLTSAGIGIAYNVLIATVSECIRDTGGVSGWSLVRMQRSWTHPYRCAL